MNGLKDKVVVITGASRGLGQGMASWMREQGIRLGLCARSEGITRMHEGDDGIVTRQLDVADPTAVKAFAAAVVDEFGGIDAWINNAGVLEPIRFVRDLSSEALSEHFQINVHGVLNGSQAYLEHRRDAGGGGVLINISSGAALKGYAGWGAYCASKAAVDRLTECIALEEQGSGLRAYSIAPGIIDTDMQKLIRAQTPEQFPMIEKFIDLKRREAFSTPSFIARHIADIAFERVATPDSVVLRLPAES